MSSMDLLDLGFDSVEVRAEKTCGYRVECESHSSRRYLIVDTK